MTSAGSSVLATGLGDHRLAGLEWIGDGKDLLLVFDTPSGMMVCLTAEWATEVRIDLNFGLYFGKPLVFSSSVDRSDGAGGILLRVEFGGAPDGSLSLRCNELIVRETTRTG